MVDTESLSPVSSAASVASNSSFSHTASHTAHNHPHDLRTNHHYRTPQRSETSTAGTPKSAQSLVTLPSQEDEELAILNEIREVLQAEVYIDIDKLGDIARHGVPSAIRGEVWKYLLGVLQADRSREVSVAKMRLDDYNQISKENSMVTKHIRGDLNRYQRRVPQLASKQASDIMENVIISYLSWNRDSDYVASMVPFCGAFVASGMEEWEVFWCFERVMGLLDEYYTSHNINERIANFMTLFRTVIPDLYSYFEEEEVDINEWATTWIQYLLAKEMQLDNLLRLWDTYFSIPNFLDFHPYVCLAILRTNKEGLEDLEQSEIRTMLMRLPTLDMARVINQAFNIQNEIMERQLSEAEENRIYL